MKRTDVAIPAVELLSHIHAAGFASVDHFIATLRVDPLADTTRLPPLALSLPSRPGRHRK
ncbi:hypothetical protein ACIHDR_09595 [Nocardia sp. NPDC052278]|uniref:hypothetical protein n=1 Tax=unclassified Nocardia TaxID=2637762 RepID=UPI003677EDC4